MQLRSKNELRKKWRGKGGRGDEEKREKGRGGKMIGGGREEEIKG